MSTSKCIFCARVLASSQVPTEIASPTLQERKQQLVRDAIWRAATDLFAEKGYDETTVEDIAKKAGVSRRSFFRYFSSKSDLMAHGTVNYGHFVVETLESLPKRYPLPRVFRETVLRIAQASAADPHTRRIMEIAARYPAARAAQLAKMVEVHDRVAEAFARRTGPGRESSSTPGILAGLTISVLAVIFRTWFEQGRKDISMAAEGVLATLGKLACEK